MKYIDKFPDMKPIFNERYGVVRKYGDLPHKRMALIWVISAVNGLLRMHDLENIDVALNEQGEIDVVYRGENNLFVIESDIAHFINVDKELLKEAFDARGTGRYW